MAGNFSTLGQRNQHDVGDEVRRARQMAQKTQGADKRMELLNALKQQHAAAKAAGVLGLPPIHDQMGESDIVNAQKALNFAQERHAQVAAARQPQQPEAMQPWQVADTANETGTNPAPQARPAPKGAPIFNTMNGKPVVGKVIDPGQQTAFNYKGQRTVNNTPEYDPRRDMTARSVVDGVVVPRQAGAPVQIDPKYGGGVGTVRYAPPPQAPAPGPKQLSTMAPAAPKAAPQPAAAPVPAAAVPPITPPVAPAPTVPAAPPVPPPIDPSGLNTAFSSMGKAVVDRVGRSVYPQPAAPVAPSAPAAPVAPAGSDDWSVAANSMADSMRPKAPVAAPAQPPSVNPIRARIDSNRGKGIFSLGAPSNGGSMGSQPAAASVPPPAKQFTPPVPADTASLDGRAKLLSFANGPALPMTPNGHQGTPPATGRGNGFGPLDTIGAPDLDAVRKANRKLSVMGRF